MLLILIEKFRFKCTVSPVLGTGESFTRLRTEFIGKELRPGSATGFFTLRTIILGTCIFSIVLGTLTKILFVTYTIIAPFSAFTSLCYPNSCFGFYCSVY